MATKRDIERELMNRMFNDIFLVLDNTTDIVVNGEYEGETAEKMIAVRSNLTVMKKYLDDMRNTFVPDWKKRNIDEVVEAANKIPPASGPKKLA